MGGKKDRSQGEHCGVDNENDNSVKNLHIVKKKERECELDIHDRANGNNQKKKL